MARTVLAVFESVFTAKLAVYDLQKDGLSGDRIGIIPRPQGSLDHVKTPTSKSRSVKMEVEQDGLGLGFRVGAGVGSAMGLTLGMMVAVGALPLKLPELFELSQIPFVWWTMLVGLATGLIIGSLSGGFLGSLAGLSIPEEEMRKYARLARCEPVMVTVMADADQLDPVMEILFKHSPMELTEKSYSRLEASMPGKSISRNETPGSASDRR